MFLFFCVFVLGFFSPHSSAWIMHTNGGGGFYDGLTRRNGASSEDTSVVEIVSLSGDEESIQRASRFMVDSFWLGNKLVQQSSGSITGKDQRDLVQEQAFDFSSTYGEIMGRRKLEAGLAAAVEDGDIIGLVGTLSTPMTRLRQCASTFPVENLWKRRRKHLS